VKAVMYTLLKRAIDIVGALAGLFLATLIFPVVAWLIKRESPGPIFFRQARIGLGGKIFRYYKFRSMREAYDAQGQPLPDAERLTRIGIFLRRTSLDELPSFWHVLRGDMSLVGPRPLLTQYLDRYSPEQSRRHEVKPGITGWAQVNGRNAISWEQKFALDVWYVDHRSLWLDIRVLFLTIWRVLRRDGISQEDHVTMAEFTGTPAAPKGDQ
jgi:lipopolysaccharide/colanic/teichoic acid biosynthesis glycosyltransferase